jgi:hypothetical protein
MWLIAQLGVNLISAPTPPPLAPAPTAPPLDSETHA